MATVVLTDHPIAALAWTSVAASPLPEALYVTLTGASMEMHLSGDSDKLDSLETWVAEMRTAIEKAMRSAPGTGGGSLQNTFNGNGFYAGELLAMLSMVKRHDKSLSLEVEHNPRLILSLTRLGLTTALLVPTLAKRSRKNRTMEAISNLDRIYRGAEDYFTTPKVDQEGNLLPCSFPASIGATPAPNCCASQGGPDKDNDGLCDAAGEPWAATTWKALRFIPEEDHRYVYEFKNLGQTDQGMEFEISAYGDLDCDGVMSTFSRFGIGTVKDGECSVKNRAALYTRNETE